MRALGCPPNTISARNNLEDPFRLGYHLLVHEPQPQDADERRHGNCKQRAHNPGELHARNDGDDDQRRRKTYAFPDVSGAMTCPSIS